MGEPPYPPVQDDPQSILCNVSDISIRFRENNPFDYLFCFKFKERAEGWFKIQNTVLFNGVPLSENFSEAFTFDHFHFTKLKGSEYTGKEVKYMQIYAATPNKQLFEE